jgi:membrane-anchored protein YejM (alkaline phosphatase superfamily)
VEEVEEERRRRRRRRRRRWKSVVCVFILIHNSIYTWSDLWSFLTCV